ncbi:hypothetical protein [Rhizobium sp. P44RR-XXIV]|uniref:hypothetical protein n=1 Tax=Rhizobium sp. P44RR-XXIV TaxID=1921145 RepID=UPI0010AAB9E7|nr:hypothetical protein [Rhizobium sp. P44RR-XXIV]TIX87729.1 hypothetical protein BSK43_033290 [Rhizobium sp. P44RR-XXIV]
MVQSVGVGDVVELARPAKILVAASASKQSLGLPGKSKTKLQCDAKPENARNHRGFFASQPPLCRGVSPEA